MKVVRQDELASLITGWIAKDGRNPNSNNINFTEDTDLLASGLLDSMGFIELLLYVESITGEKMDLSDLDPSDFTSVSGLSRSVLKHKTKTG